MELVEMLDEILNCKSLYYGTILCQRENLQLWWSPFEWMSPNDGLKSQPGNWLCLGQSTWWGNDEQKRRYRDLLVEIGDEMPQSPGEWIYFDNLPRRSWRAECALSVKPAGVNGWPNSASHLFPRRKTKNDLYQ